MAISPSWTGRRYSHSALTNRQEDCKDVDCLLFGDALRSQQHGQQAIDKVHGSISFYNTLFKKSTKLDWQQVRGLALDFQPVIQQKWPAYLDEMQDGAKVELADILALNVRTEINFGMFSDGCTALSWKTDSASFLAQNWDWMTEQQGNLVPVVIEQEGKPTIKMITEAGIIGKIGFNTSGVGICLNAIRARGMDVNRLPCHLGLRMALESTSCADAVARLNRYGIASSCHMLLADAKESIGLEWSSIDVQQVQMNAKQQIFHSNHYLLEHPGVIDTVWLPDSPFRVTRIEELCRDLSDSPTLSELGRVFEDEGNAPASICRLQTEQTGSATVFNIVMDLMSTQVVVRFGRPNASTEVYRFP
ncbi:hypothetical protein AMS68_002926 [Peltaster fructicola]|uniref:Peptidase C45 hydrolase domain-containing protein n=1 Tax=Peltaster fructicola TaxID=286661 RepID=A0A6H0XS05_9PEZI|nr:hypothetical protein AMS68_002926 [Peltaster fructicola]